MSNQLATPTPRVRLPMIEIARLFGDRAVQHIKAELARIVAQEPYMVGSNWLDVNPPRWVQIVTADAMPVFVQAIGFTNNFPAFAANICVTEFLRSFGEGFERGIVSIGEYPLPGGIPTREQLIHQLLPDAHIETHTFRRNFNGHYLTHDWKVALPATPDA